MGTDSRCGGVNLPDDEPPQCWLCGLLVPGGRPTAKGWVTRRIRFQAVRLTERYCPECHEDHGFPELVKPPRRASIDA